MANKTLLPIKVVLPERKDYFGISGGGNTKVFDNGATDAVRTALSLQLDEVRSRFSESFRNVPVVAKVDLKKQARAKTHRPTALFDSDTCPIIGGGDFGELYVGVTPKGLDRVSETIKNTDEKQMVANISTISRITPYSEDDVLEGKTLDDLQPRRKRSGSLRVRLFRHLLDGVNEAIDTAFRGLAKAAKIRDIDMLDYAEGTRVFRVSGLDRRAVAAIASFPGTQSISTFPQYHVVRTASRTIEDVSEASFPSPKKNGRYGLVGIIDSGTDPSNRHLQAWVVDRKEWVPRTKQDNSHGSFVAGLVIHGRKLNHDDERFPGVSSKIVDVVAFDDSGTVSEHDLLMIIDDALKRFPKVKVWNLSIGLDGAPCSNKGFSLFAAHLDSRARKHNVLFVVAAGNYDKPPYRSWPPTGKGIGEDDRIRPPADALRILTIGSRAHIENNSTVVRRDEPSPFSRRGPAPAYIIKPDLAGHGGNCDKDGKHGQSGVISIDGKGHIAENIGTSFACPPAASLAANVYQELDAPNGDASPLLMRGLMIHSAFMHSHPLDKNRVYYDGFGAPGDMAEMLQCTQSAATLILQVPLFDDEDFAKEFPMPPCLKVPDVGLRGEVFMSLVYDPPLNHKDGFEYARSNVRASLGTVGIDPGTRKELQDYRREVEPTPKALTKDLETSLVENGFKWAPTKLYYREFTRGPVSRKWKLSLSLLHRSGFVTDEAQDVVLIVTVRDHIASGFVYDGMVREMSRLGWKMHDLPLRSQARLRP